MSGLVIVDMAVVALIGIACLRGVVRGLVREVFSIGGLVAAVIVVRVWNPVFAPWLETWSDGQIGSAVAPWVGGAVLGTLAIALIAALGAMARRGARAAGLGLADRAGGAVVGFAEGAIVAGVALMLLATALGRDHSLLAESRTMAALDRIEAADTGSLSFPGDVAAPPPSR